MWTKEKKPFCTVGWNINYYSDYGKYIVWRFLKKSNIELPYNPAILLLVTYSKESR